MDKFSKSAKLDHVCYDIRGPVHKKALQLEEEGHKILKLNIGREIGRASCRERV